MAENKSNESKAPAAKAYKFKNPKHAKGLRHPRMNVVITEDHLKNPNMVKAIQKNDQLFGLKWMSEIIE